VEEYSFWTAWLSFDPIIPVFVSADAVADVTDPSVFRADFSCTLMPDKLSDRTKNVLLKSSHEPPKRLFTNKIHPTKTKYHQLELLLTIPYDH